MSEWSEARDRMVAAIMAVPEDTAIAVQICDTISRKTMETDEGQVRCSVAGASLLELSAMSSSLTSSLVDQYGRTVEEAGPDIVGVGIVVSTMAPLASLPEPFGKAAQSFVLATMLHITTEVEKQNAASDTADGAIAKEQASAANESEG